MSKNKRKNISINNLHYTQKSRLILPKQLVFVYRILKEFDNLFIWFFLLKKYPNISFTNKLDFLRKIFLISYHVPCTHTEYELLSVIDTIISMLKSMKGCIVEAGTFKGGSTAKLSLASRLMNKKLILFDSFKGLPENSEYYDEKKQNSEFPFKKGSYSGSLKEVKSNISKYGSLNNCKFIKGWFKNTMVNFSTPISLIYLDVDLASSTRTCLKYLFPLLVPGGFLYSHDGHLPLVRAVFEDEDFWKKEVGCQKPIIYGLGKRKLIKIVKS
ncbi:MAG: TylF/MycF/NovP-related O-methyltransferase [Nanoarchaeota archaeon]